MIIVLLLQMMGGWEGCKGWFMLGSGWFMIVVVFLWSFVLFVYGPFN